MENYSFDPDRPERVVLYGEDVSRNIPPRDTLLPENHPVVTFMLPDGSGFALNESLLSKGLLLTGETGCGKTSVICHCAASILDTLGEEDIAVILDVKGDFADRYFDPDNEKHIIFSGSGPYARYASAWNIYLEVLEAACAEEGSDSPHENVLDAYAYDIANDVFYDRAGTSQPFFAQAAQTIFASVLSDHIKAAMETEDDFHLHNGGLFRFFRNASPQTYADLVSRYPQLRNYLGEKENTQALGVLGSVSSAVNNSFVGIFGQGLGPRKTFTITDLMEKRGGRVLFIEYDLALADSLGSMYRLLFDLLLKSLLSLRNSGRGNVWLFLDELRTLPELHSLERALNLGRSKGLKCIAGCQEVSQLYTVYKEAEASSLLEGFTNVFAFRSKNPETHKMIADRSGDVYEFLSFRINGRPQETHREGKAIESWDILSLDTGESYILLSGHKPFRFHFPHYKK